MSRGTFREVLPLWMTAQNIFRFYPVSVASRIVMRIPPIQGNVAGLLNLFFRLERSFWLIFQHLTFPFVPLAVPPLLVWWHPVLSLCPWPGSHHQPFSFLPKTTCNWLSSSSGPGHTLSILEDKDSPAYSFWVGVFLENGRECPKSFQFLKFEPKHLLVSWIWKEFPFTAVMGLWCQWKMVHLYAPLTKFTTTRKCLGGIYCEHPTHTIVSNVDTHCWYLR